MSDVTFKPATIVPAGDAAALVEFADEISLDVNAQVHALARAIEATRPKGIGETVPAYSTLLIQYDPLATTLEDVGLLVQRLASGEAEAAFGAARLREIPAVYGGAYGPDLPSVAQRLNMTEEEVVRLQTSVDYTVYMLGFAPGHPYLGGLPPQLVLPRLQSPRPLVPRGSVAIANQATVYAMDTPGGWHLIGRTAVRLFTPEQDPPTY
ncbi:MAG TPA: 5-oxoprolinase subunit PxpB, partial [Chloroflexota bacterium]|nr:5-oxoprolinase subunit PxpB [Chloroflexota bacterium]